MHKLVLAPTTLPETPMLDYVEAAARAGYDAVGLRLYRSPGLPFFPVDGRQLGRRLRELSLPVHDLFTFYIQPDTNPDDFRPALSLGAELGARYAMVIGADTDWPRLSDKFGRVCDIAAGVGLTIVIEFVPFRELQTLQQALRLIAETGRPNAAICVDPLHFARGGGQPADLKGLDPKLFPYCQMSDGVLAPGEPDLARAKSIGLGTRKLPGEGTLPLRELLAALPAGLPLSIEMPYPAGDTASPTEFATRVLAATKRFLAG